MAEKKEESEESREKSLNDWLEGRVAMPNFVEGYKLVEKNDRRFVWDDDTGAHPTPKNVKLIVQWVKQCGAQGITSIGCGNGVLEWFLSEHFPPLAIHGVDVHYGKDLIPMARWSIMYGPIKKTEIASIPKDHALLFSWPLCKVFQKYLKAYKGPCLIIISDMTCTPHPPFESKTGKADNAFEGWKLMHQSFVGKRDEIFVYYPIK